MKKGPFARLLVFSIDIALPSRLNYDFEYDIKSLAPSAYTHNGTNTHAHTHMQEPWWCKFSLDAREVCEMVNVCALPPYTVWYIKRFNCYLSTLLSNAENKPHYIYRLDTHPHAIQNDEKNVSKLFGSSPRHLHVDCLMHCSASAAGLSFSSSNRDKNNNNNHSAEEAKLKHRQITQEPPRPMHDSHNRVG